MCDQLRVTKRHHEQNHTLFKNEREKEYEKLSFKVLDPKILKIQ